MLNCRKQPLVGLLVVVVVVASMGSLARAQTNEAPQAASSTAAAPASDKVKLSVYMESLCPDTRRFFLGQLVPAQRAIGQAIDLRLVPFGHARTLGNNNMVCQHGARECEGNRRMACLLVRSTSQSQLVDTFACLFGLDEDAKTCVARHMAHVNFDELEKCTAGDESYQLMVRAEQETGKLGYVPHLTVNGQSSEEIQDQAEHRLTEFLCKQYKGQEPLEACKSLPAAAAGEAQQQQQQQQEPALW